MERSLEIKKERSIYTSYNTIPEQINDNIILKITKIRERASNIASYGENRIQQLPIRKKGPRNLKPELRI
jgi:hypothetical protein